MSNHYELRHATDYIAELTERDGTCTEIVSYRGELIHTATFPSSNLGNSARSVYLECMVASAVRMHEQALKQAATVSR
jgi:hypothetical protein